MFFLVNNSRITRIARELDEVVGELKNNFHRQTGYNISNLKIQQTIAKLIREERLNNKIRFKVNKNKREFEVSL